MSTLSVAVCQFAAGTDVDANTKECATRIAAAAAAGADLAVLPEAAMFFNPEHIKLDHPAGEPIDGEFATNIANAAKENQIGVIVGMYEDVDDPNRHSNTLLAVGKGGERLGIYRKIHLYDAFGHRESDTVVPGDITEPLVFELNGLKVGALTCYDLRFPEAFRWALGDGLDVIALPAAWVAGPAKEYHWETLVEARAIENTVYVAAAGQTGPASCGQSMIVDPLGTRIADAGERPGIAIGTVDSERIEYVRALNPSLANRRFEVTAKA